jgi:mRNA interferase MazF
MNSRGIDVLIEQTAAVAPERLGPVIGHACHDEQTAIDHALLLALQLD